MTTLPKLTRPRNAFPPEARRARYAQVIHLWNAGWSMKAIAAQVNLTVPRIWQILKAAEDAQQEDAND